MGTGNFNVGGNPAMDQHLIQGGVKILLVASCYTNRDERRINLQLSASVRYRHRIGIVKL